MEPGIAQRPEVMIDFKTADLNGAHEAEARGHLLQAAEPIDSREQGGDASHDIDEEEEEEEEEEPRLKYQRLGSSVIEILRQDAASCLCVSSKLLALGTHDGTIHVLDFAGNEVQHQTFSIWTSVFAVGARMLLRSICIYSIHNRMNHLDYCILLLLEREVGTLPQTPYPLQVKRFEVHKSKVNDISIDDAVEFIASCSDDGSAAVSHSLCGKLSIACHPIGCLLTSLQALKDIP